MNVHDLIERIRFIMYKINEESTEFDKCHYYDDNNLRSSYRSYIETMCKKYLNNDMDIIILEYLISKIFDENHNWNIYKEYDKGFIKAFRKLCEESVTNGFDYRYD
jgi:hypothetical protein